MNSRATIAPILLVGMIVVSSLPAGSEKGCGSSRFDCGEGFCIPIRKFCDRVHDCGNNRDEDWCIRNGDSVYCSKCNFACDNRTRCVVSWFVCDGQKDCQDGSDEMYCPETKQALKLRCDTGTEPTSTLAASSEEATTAEAISATSTSPLDCNVDDGDFPCMDGRCLLSVQVCDGMRDCSDGADEGLLCRFVRRGNQQPQQQHGLRGWLVDLRMQFRVLPQSLRDWFNLTAWE